MTKTMSAGILWHGEMMANDSRNNLCGRLPQKAPTPCKLTFLTLKVVSLFST